MKKLLTIVFCFCSLFLFSQSEGRTVISLNGQWEFDQTKTAFPPAKYTRKIPVPGLVHLAQPRIEQYDKLFQKPAKVEKMELRHDFFTDYTPMYSWYKKKIKIDKSLSDQKLFLTIKKSQYVTVVYVNGMLMGRSVECYTPIDVDITGAVKFGGENEILIQVGDRAWLPSEAAGSTDKEKIRYLSGIWDDVFITATGNIKVDRVLFLPSLAKKSVTAKILVRSVFPPQLVEIDPKEDPCRVMFTIKEKKSGKTVSAQTIEGPAKRDNKTYFEVSIPVQDPVAWSPENPFLYEGEVKIYHRDQLTDTYTVNFGMRDFKAQGRMFALNGSKYYLRGSNITLQRFFEDPDCGNLVWDREWVKKMLIDIPKSLDWNAMRICVSVVPDFWYDLCDEYGILLQNEWLYWQVHGWDYQLRQEYTNWVWSDGNHPSIVIWDAINENWNPYVGNVLIPELKQLDFTRIWDAGWMSAEDMGKNKEMDEPHPYRMASYETLDSLQMARQFRNRPYNLGKLSEYLPSRILDAGVPQLVNEYGWIFLWRNGSPSKISINNYNYYLGRNATPEACRNMQAYWLQLETEWLRSERSLAGVLAFCYLANNYAYTGDWFINHIKDLEPSPTLQWFKHCFAPEAVFIDLTDERYTKHVVPHQPGSDFVFNMVGINDLNKRSEGKLLVKLLDDTGKVVIKNQSEITIDPYGKLLIPSFLKLPEKTGGYVIVAEYYPRGQINPVISRRFIKIGESKSYNYHELKPDRPSQNGETQGFVKTSDSKFIDGTGNEIVFRGMGFWGGNGVNPPGNWRKENYAKLADVGFNCVRLYMGANFWERNNGTDYNPEAFAWLDQQIEWAKKYHINLILNFHHTPAASSISDRTFFTDANRQTRLARLWKAIAMHVKNEPTVVGFDIINEPTVRVENAGGNRAPYDCNGTPYLKYYTQYQEIIQNIVDAIREVDMNHIIIAERLWLDGGHYSFVQHDQRDCWQNVNGKYNFPDINDPANNYAYTYHCYEPNTYCHQTLSNPPRTAMYPSDKIARHNEGPNGVSPWRYTKEYLDYAYTIPLHYVREIKKVPAYIGEIGIHEGNYQYGGAQYMEDVYDILLNKYRISCSFHPYNVHEISPNFNVNHETAFRKAFGKK